MAKKRSAIPPTLAKLARAAMRWNDEWDGSCPHPSVTRLYKACAAHSIARWLAKQKEQKGKR